MSLSSLSIYFASVSGAFLAGILSSLSPCVYPMIPITVASLTKNKGGSLRNVFGFALGQFLTLMALGFIAVRLGETLGFTSQIRWIKQSVGVILTLAGLLSLKGDFGQLGASWNQAVSRWTMSLSLNFLGAFLLGVASSLVLSPCTSPILGSTLAWVATQEHFPLGIICMMAYAVGFVTIFIGLGIGLSRILKLPRAGRWMTILHSISSWLLIGLGVGLFIDMI